MTEEFEENLYKTWDSRWKGAQNNERLTFLGHLMFHAKRKKLLKILSYLNIKTVIEAGCGLGHILEVYYKAGYDCIGLDVSRNAINVCYNKGLPVKLKRLEDESGKYDLVSSDGMLEHFLNFEPHAKQLMRISRKYILLIQPNYDSFTGKTIAYLASLFRSRVNVYEYNYRIIDFINMFQRNGFKIHENMGIFFNVFRLLVFKKECSTDINIDCFNF